MSEPSYAEPAKVQPHLVYLGNGNWAVTKDD